MADIDTVCWELNEQGLGDKGSQNYQLKTDVMQSFLTLSWNWFSESLTVRPGPKTVENPNRTDELRSFNCLLAWKCNYYIRNR